MSSDIKVDSMPFVIPKNCRESTDATLLTSLLHALWLSTTSAHFNKNVYVRVRICECHIYKFITEKQSCNGTYFQVINKKLNCTEIIDARYENHRMPIFLFD